MECQENDVFYIIFLLSLSTEKDILYQLWCHNGSRTKMTLISFTRSLKINVHNYKLIKYYKLLILLNIIHY